MKYYYSEENNSYAVYVDENDISLDDTYVEITQEEYEKVLEERERRYQRMQERLSKRV